MSCAKNMDSTNLNYIATGLRRLLKMQGITTMYLFRIEYDNGTERFLSAEDWRDIYLKLAERDLSGGLIKIELLGLVE